MKTIDKQDFDKMPLPSVSARFTFYFDDNFDKTEIENLIGLKAKFCKLTKDAFVNPETKQKAKGFISFCSNEKDILDVNEILDPMIDYMFSKQSEIKTIQQKWNGELKVFADILLKSFKTPILRLSNENITKLEKLGASFEPIIMF